MIPKRIYYVWFGGGKLPEYVEKNIQTWKKYNPTFQICRIDENNFDINKYDFVNQALRCKNWAFASDVARLDVVYNNGGFYFDTDVFFLKSLDSLLEKHSVWGMENSGLVNSGLIIGAQKGDEDIKEILKIYNKLKFSPENIKDLITTRIISAYFKSKGLCSKNKLQVLKNGTYIYPSEYFAPFHWWGGGRITKKSIVVHQFTQSWGKKTIIGFRERCYWEVLLFFPKFFHKKNKFIRFVFLDTIFPFVRIKFNSKIVLYGYGQVGKEFLKQIQATHYCKIVGIVDQNWKKLDGVEDPQTIKNFDFNYIVVAVNSPKLIKDIRKKILSIDKSFEKLIVCK